MALFEPPVGSILGFKASQFWLYEDPDPAFHSHADSDPASQNNADPDPQPYICLCVYGSNGNASKTKANKSFDNGVFFDIEAKRTPSIVSKLFSKRSEHIR